MAGDKDWGRYPPLSRHRYTACEELARGWRSARSARDTGRERSNLKGGGRFRLSVRLASGHMVAGGARGGERCGLDINRRRARISGGRARNRRRVRRASAGHDRPPGAPVIARNWTGRGRNRAPPRHHRDRCRPDQGGRTTRVAIAANDGLAKRNRRSTHGAFDGDTIFAAATGARPLATRSIDLTMIGAMAAKRPGPRDRRARVHGEISSP